MKARRDTSFEKEFSGTSSDIGLISGRTMVDTSRNDQIRRCARKGMEAAAQAMKHIKLQPNIVGCESNEDTSWKSGVTKAWLNAVMYGLVDRGLVLELVPEDLKNDLEEVAQSSIDSGLKSYHKAQKRDGSSYEEARKAMIKSGLAPAVTGLTEVLQTSQARLQLKGRSKKKYSRDGKMSRKGSSTTSASATSSGETETSTSTKSVWETVQLRPKTRSDSNPKLAVTATMHPTSGAGSTGFTLSLNVETTIKPAQAKNGNCKEAANQTLTLTAKVKVKPASPEESVTTTPYVTFTATATMDASKSQTKSRRHHHRTLLANSSQCDKCTTSTRRDLKTAESRHSATQAKQKSIASDGESTRRRTQAVTTSVDESAPVTNSRVVGTTSRPVTAAGDSSRTVPAKHRMANAIETATSKETAGRWDTVRNIVKQGTVMASEIGKFETAGRVVGSLTPYSGILAPTLEYAGKYVDKKAAEWKEQGKDPDKHVDD